MEARGLGGNLPWQQDSPEVQCKSAVVFVATVKHQTLGIGYAVGGAGEGESSPSNNIIAV